MNLEPFAYLPLLIGVVEDNGRSMTVRGPSTLICLPSGVETRSLLQALDGSSTVDDIARASPLPRSKVEGCIADLTRAGLVIDSCQRWKWFHSASSNPMPIRRYEARLVTTKRWEPSPHLPRTRVGIPAELLRFADEPRAPRAGSYARRDDLKVNAKASENLALITAHVSYRRDIDYARRPVASAGGIGPLHLLTVGADQVSQSRRLLWISDDDFAVELARVSVDECASWLVPDPILESLVHQGAAFVVIAADPRISVRKYGDRGWRYILLEAGALAHEIALVAAHFGGVTRPVGGFLDARLGSHVEPLIPILLVSLLVDQSWESPE